MTSERWLPVPGWDDMYEVSSLGEVKSIERWVSHPAGGMRLVKERILSQWFQRGYPSVCLSNTKKKRKICTVHRLVLEAFIGPRPAGMECCHADGDRENNNLENLRWGTREENRADTERLRITNFGPAPAACKLTALQVIEIRKRAAGGATRAQLRADFCVSKTCIRGILSGHTWGWLKDLTSLMVRPEEVENSN